MKQSGSAELQIVLDLEGLQLVIARTEDFVRLPALGSVYFVRGTLYEVSEAPIETVGEAKSSSGSALLDLLSRLYTESGKAAELYSTARRFDDQSGPRVAAIASPAVLVTARGERFVYARLRRKSLVAEPAE